MGRAIDNNYWLCTVHGIGSISRCSLWMDVNRVDVLVSELNFHTPIVCHGCTLEFNICRKNSLCTAVLAGVYMYMYIYLCVQLRLLSLLNPALVLASGKRII